MPTHQEKEAGRARVGEQSNLGVTLMVALFLWAGLGSGALEPNAGSAGGDRGAPSERVATVVVPNRAGALAGKRIVIDPGHGGGDPGAKSASGQEEADNTLAIGLELSHLLQQDGANVTLTRASDAEPATGTAYVGRRDASLAARVAIAETRAADAFISIHNDWNVNKALSGTTTYYQRGASLALAHAVQDATSAALGAHDLGVQYGNFEVIRDTTMPAALIEVGFVSNSQEAAKLSDPQYRRRAAAGIERGLAAYFAG